MKKAARFIPMFVTAIAVNVGMAFLIKHYYTIVKEKYDTKRRTEIQFQKSYGH